METRSPQRTNVVRFPGSRGPARPAGISAVSWTLSILAGSLPIAADDRATKVMATRLTIFGFVVIDEVQADGTARRLRPSEAFHASLSSSLARLETQAGR